MARTWKPCFVVTTDLYGKPEVGIIAAALGLDRHSVVSRLVRFWIEAQRKADDRGVLAVQWPWVDALVDCPGFGRAMASAGWLSQYGDGLLVPRFKERISRDAVNRTLNTFRRQRAKCDEDAGNNGGHTGATRGPHGGQPNLPGIKSKPERKPRGVKVEDPNFWKFWRAYPKQVNQPAAAAAWAALTPDDLLVEAMLKAIEAWKLSPQWTKRGLNGEDFIPHPANWLEGRRWQDRLDGEGAGGRVQPGARVRGGEYGTKPKFKPPGGEVPDKPPPSLF